MLFVGGLHRSGTTLLAEVLSTAPGAAGLVGTGVPRDEGQHLQSVYPPAKRFGGPGRFALHPGAHLTEADALTPEDDRHALQEAWAPFWSSGDAAVLVEKSPPNLIRMRYLQAVFPDASFVVVVRHPIPVALATRKMSEGATLPTRMENWFAGHRTLRDDLPYVDRVLMLGYESLVAGAEAAWHALEGFTGLALRRPPLDDESNQRYFQRWRANRNKPTFRAAAEVLRRNADTLAHYGYDPEDGDDPEGSGALPARAK